jgi:hypothetical protein
VLQSGRLRAPRTVCSARRSGSALRRRVVLRAAGSGCRAVRLPGPPGPNDRPCVQVERAEVRQTEASPRLHVWWSSSDVGDQERPRRPVPDQHHIGRAPPNDLVSTRTDTCACLVERLPSRTGSDGRLREGGENRRSELVLMGKPVSSAGLSQGGNDLDLAVSQCTCGGNGLGLVGAVLGRGRGVGDHEAPEALQAGQRGRVQLPAAGRRPRLDRGPPVADEVKKHVLTQPVSGARVSRSPRGFRCVPHDGRLAESDRCGRQRRPSW